MGSRAVVDAFATVPRERFVGPGPWRVLSPMALGAYWTTEDADPRHLYHDVLIAIDEEPQLNNGQSLCHRMCSQLQLREGAHVVHIGDGTGYYSAILAKIVGHTGRVTAIEIDPAWPPGRVRTSPHGGKRRSSQPTDSPSTPTGRPTPSSSMPA